MSEDNKKREIDAMQVVSSEDADQHAEAAEIIPDDPAVQMEAELDELSMVELVPQPEIDTTDTSSDADVEHVDPVPQVNIAPENEVDAAEVAVTEAVADNDNNAEQDSEANAAKQKKPSKNSGIALPSFVERSNTGVFGTVGTKTGIPLPASVDNEAHDNDDQDSNAAPEAKQQFPEPQRTVISKDKEIEKAREIEEEHSQVRSEFSDEDDHHTQAGVEFTQTEVDEPQEDAMPARQLGAALTANSLVGFEQLSALADYPHLYQALLSIKGTWQRTVSMDELMVAAARADQSDGSNEEIKNWYAMRIKKLVVNALDFVWIANSYSLGEDGLLIIDDEQLFIALTGVSASDFREMCSRGFINHTELITLVQQFKLWEAEAFNPAEYIFSHLQRERMVA